MGATDGDSTEMTTDMMADDMMEEGSSTSTTTAATSTSTTMSTETSLRFENGLCIAATTAITTMTDADGMETVERADPVDGEVPTSDCCDTGKFDDIPECM